MDDSTFPADPEKKGDANVISKDWEKQPEEKSRIPKHFENNDSLNEAMLPKEPLKPEILKQ